MTTRTFTLILLLTLSLPLSALAMGTTDNPKAELQALIAAAEKEVAATPAWQQAEKAKRQRLSEVAVRKKIITTVQSGFDSMQKRVDRKIDELLEKSLGKMLDSQIPEVLRSNFKELFKEELYKYMYRNEETNIEQTYERAKGREGNLNLLFTEGLKNNRAFENELLEIIKNANSRIKMKIPVNFIIELKNIFFGEFNNL